MGAMVRKLEIGRWDRFHTGIKNEGGASIALLVPQGWWVPIHLTTHAQKCVLQPNIMLNSALRQGTALLLPAAV